MGVNPAERELWLEGRRALQEGRYALAARKLSQLAAMGQSVATEAELQVQLANAEARCGRLRITADVLGAQILVDGEVAGTIPLARPWYVAAGAHEVELRAPQLAPVKRSVQAPFGIATEVDFRVMAEQRALRANAQAAALMGTEAGQKPPETDFSATTTLHAVVLSTTTLLTVGALAAGWASHLKALDHDIEADVLRARLTSVPEPSGQACNPDSVFLNVCRQMEREQLDAYDAKLRARNYFIAFGALGALTATYAVILLSGGDEPPRTAVRAGAGISSQGAMLSLSSQF